jgi:hypothetical protein
LTSDKTRRPLTLIEKYKTFVSVLTGQAMQRRAPTRGVDCSTVMHVCRAATG